MQKRYVISDIHGNARAFLKLLDHVDPNPEELVILGDLCDRGLDTWGVFEECAQLLDEGADIVVGNHDIWFAQFLANKIPKHYYFGESVGGMTTAKSLEIAEKKHTPAHVGKVVQKVLDGMVPYLENDKFIFVHAGIDPRIPYMEDQKTEVLTMGCQEWKNPHTQHTFDQTIVFGHVPTPSIHRGISEDDARIWSSNKARKMAIDTGAGFGMRLTMADLQEGIAYAYDFKKRDIIEYRFKRRENL